VEKEIESWYSPRLQREMSIARWGHYGQPLLMFPTWAADYLEYERFHLVESLRPYIEAGVIKCYSIDSPNRFSWMDEDMPTWMAAQVQNAYNGYITEEVVPFIRADCNSPDIRIAVTGASAGAYHSGNQFFRRPDLFSHLIGLSGGYSLQGYCKDGYYDENCFYNDPEEFMKGLDGDAYWLLRNHCSINLVGGSGNYENPEAARRMGRILESRSIPVNVDIWGADVHHDWPWWRKMLPYYVGRLFT
jgi:esterase/lipase superfamily enzyme